jgi:hypothetical protein
MSSKPKPVSFFLPGVIKHWTKENLDYWGKLLGEQVYEVQDIKAVTDMDAFDISFKDGRTRRVSGQRIAEYERHLNETTP